MGKGFGTKFLKTEIEGMRRLQESGLVNHWFDQEMEKVAQLSERVTKSTESEAQSIQHLKGPFGLYGLLMAVSVLVFLLEVLLGREKRWNSFNNASRNAVPITII